MKNTYRNYSATKEQIEDYDQKERALQVATLVASQKDLHYFRYLEQPSRIAKSVIRKLIPDEQVYYCDET
jgi:hypothetical protein